MKFKDAVEILYGPEQERRDQRYLDREPSEADEQRSKIFCRAKIKLMDQEWMLDTLYGNKIMKDIGAFVCEQNPRVALELQKHIKEKLWSIACNEAAKEI